MTGKMRLRKLLGLGVVSVALFAFIACVGALQRRLGHTEQALALATARQTHLQAALATANARVEELEVSARDAAELAARLKETERTVDDLKARLTSASRQITTLQTRLVLAQASRDESMEPNASTAGAVELDPVAVGARANAAVSGKIVQLHPEWEFVVLNVGWDQVSVGDVLKVFRQRQLLAEVQIERVQEQAAAARILPAYRTVALAVDDEVMRP